MICYLEWIAFIFSRDQEEDQKACHMQERQLSLFSLCTYLLWSNPRFTFWFIFFQSDMLPLFFSGLLSYLIGMKRRTSRFVTCKRQLSLFFVMYLSPLKPKSCAGHNSHTVFDNIWKGHVSGQVRVLHARRTTLALYFSSYLPWTNF